MVFMILGNFSTNSFLVDSFGANVLIRTELSVCEIVSLYAREVTCNSLSIVILCVYMYSFSTALINKK